MCDQQEPDAPSTLTTSHLAPVPPASRPYPRPRPIEPTRDQGPSQQIDNSYLDPSIRPDVLHPQPEPILLREQPPTPDQQEPDAPSTLTTSHLAPVPPASRPYPRHRPIEPTRDQGPSQQIDNGNLDPSIRPNVLHPQPEPF